MGLILTYTRAAEPVTHMTIFGYGEQGTAKFWYTISTQPLQTIHFYRLTHYKRSFSTARAATTIVHF